MLLLKCFAKWELQLFQAHSDRKREVVTLTVASFFILSALSPGMTERASSKDKRLLSRAPTNILSFQFLYVLYVLYVVYVLHVLPTLHGEMNMGSTDESGDKLINSKFG